MANIIKKITRRYADNAKQWAKVVPQTVRTVKSAATRKRVGDALALKTANNERSLSGARDMFNRGEYELGTYWGETKSFPKEVKDLRRYNK
jgi:hypothetical protein